MKLDKLILTNFKGIKYFEMTPHGKDASVFADNKLGKTTIADSLPWLFYDLDSQGKTFNPKPLDLTGEAAHGIASIVEATFTFDDETDDLTLKKSLCEDWRKRHGSGKKVFEGHTTTYYIDDMEVSVRKKDYDERLSRIANSTILKLLSNTLICLTICLLMKISY
jgi:predicted ATP-dependent endonuclease of OLD family